MLSSNRPQKTQEAIRRIQGYSGITPKTPQEQIADVRKNFKYFIGFIAIIGVFLVVSVCCNNFTSTDLKICICAVCLLCPFITIVGVKGWRDERIAELEKQLPRAINN